ncbi:MAG: alginate lyase family protein [Dehalococcoidia bacterium]
MSFDFLRKRAEECLTQGPYSVVHKTELAASDDPHDYVSLSLYAWPSDDGVYKLHDGHINPETHGDKFDRVRLREMIKAVKNLALAQQVFADSRYGQRATELVRVWFLDPETLMHPHLAHAQVIPGRAPGSMGIIDTYEFWSMLDAVDILIREGFLTDAETNALQAWFAALVTWLDQDPMGIEERNKTNNHGTSYDVQVIRYLMFIGDIPWATRIMEQAIEGRLEQQILPDGTQPREARRTKSLHYHWYNLTKMCNMAELGTRLGIDFLHHKNLIRGAIEYLLPFVDHPEDWPLEQIAPVTTINLLEPVFVGMKLFDLPSSRDIWERHFGHSREGRIFPLLPYRTLVGGEPALPTISPTNSA